MRILVVIYQYRKDPGSEATHNPIDDTSYNIFWGVLLAYVGIQFLFPYLLLQLPKLICTRIYERSIIVNSI